MFGEYSCKRDELDAQHWTAHAAGGMDVLEVLGSSDVILPMLATAMTRPIRSAPGSVVETNPGLQQQQTRQNMPPVESTKGSLSAAVREKDPAQQQPAVCGAPAAAHVEAQTDGTMQDQDQLQLESIKTSGAGQTQEGPDESCGHLQLVAPGAQCRAQSQNCHEAGPSDTASLKPGDGSQARTPIWVQPDTPLPNPEQMSPPRSLGQANTRNPQQQQWQEQWQDQGHTTQAGLALATMRPPRAADAHLQQGFGQIVAPLDQQQLTQKQPPHSNVESADSKIKPSMTGIVAPVYVQHDAEEAGRSSAASPMHASQEGAPQQNVDGQDDTCHAQQAAASIPEQDEMHEQSKMRPTPLAASSTGQAGGVSVPEHSHRAQHDQQAQHAQHPQPAQHAQQTQHAQGQVASHHPTSEADKADTCQQSNCRHQAADQPQCCGAVQHQHPQDSWQYDEHAVACHSGIVPGEPVVSSREHAQRHLLNAAPLPWQQPETQGIAELPEKRHGMMAVQK